MIKTKNWRNKVVPVHIGKLEDYIAETIAERKCWEKELKNYSADDVAHVLTDIFIKILFGEFKKEGNENVS